PEILLVDEPTASLDPKTSRQIMRLIAALCEERTLPAIVNLHDVGLARQFATRIVGLRRGEVVYDGPPTGLDAATLTLIYGEEDWTAVLADAHGEREDGAAPAADAPAAAAAGPGEVDQRLRARLT
ncbi:MAG: hypothetical protein AB7O45_18600, partial [Alphaproteobacteria bacterium]